MPANQQPEPSLHEILSRHSPENLTPEHIMRHAQDVSIREAHQEILRHLATADPVDLMNLVGQLVIVTGPQAGHIIEAPASRPGLPTQLVAALDPLALVKICARAVPSGAIDLEVIPAFARHLEQNAISRGVLVCQSSIDDPDLHNRLVQQGTRQNTPINITQPDDIAALMTRHSVGVTTRSFTIYRAGPIAA